MRKTRTWICPCCSGSWHRTKHSNPVYCSRCKEYTVQGRKYFTQRKCKHMRVRDKIREFKERYQTKPRTNLGMLLHISRQTKQSFKKCLKVKTRPNFIRKANEFVQAISKDILLYKPDDATQKSWVKTLNRDGSISKSRGGMTGIPLVRISNVDMHSTRGLYSRHFLQGVHEIIINCKEPFPEMPGTLLHEVLHYVDANCGMDCDGHDYFWNTRLEFFKSKFGIN